MTTANDIITVARGFLGVRFAHQGRSMHGLDCLGLLLLTAATARLTFHGQGVTTIDVPNYTMRPNTDFLMHKLDTFLCPVESAQLADVVLLEIDGAPQHLAIVSDYPVAGSFGMIHALAATRKVVEHRYDERWQNATRRIYRLPQLT